jgi:hypothetical protein
MMAARKKKKVKRIPPPLEPLPYHLIPKKLIEELNINPPLMAKRNNATKDKRYDKMTTKLEGKMNAKPEVYEVIA